MPSLHVERLCALALVAFSLNGVGFAQVARQHHRRVIDQQNAVIPGAAVTMKDVLTGVATKAVTNQTGYYEVNFLDPGTYSVSVEAAGFKTMIRDGIILETGDRLAIDLKLEVGQTNQSVEVTGENAAGGHHIGRRRPRAWTTAKSRSCPTPP